MKREIQKVSAGIFLLAAIMASRLCADVVKITLPQETASFKAGPGSSLANGQCLTCHSVEYVATQPPLSLNAWTAEVKKMKDKYGAPVPDDQITALAEYLAGNYGIVTNQHAATVTVQTAPAVAPAMSVVTMATRYGCLTCHKVDVKVVGPAFKDVRAKYLNDPDAIKKICRQIHNGGTGKWGSAIMPPFTAVSDAEAKRLAAWVMNPESAK